MPNKYLNKKGIDIKPQKYRVQNWSQYNDALRKRGSIEVWLSEEVIEQWYVKDRIYDGTGAPDVYSDLAILTCHEIRKVYRLPLRQSQGFIDSLFRLQKLPLSSPDFSTLSKRLKKLNLKAPRYRKTDKPEDIAAIAIDSTGLKRFGRDEWHQEKHKISGKRSWRKLHVAVDEAHYIQASDLTDRFVPDAQVVENLISQMSMPITHATADAAYDEESVYETIAQHSPECDIVIQPQKNAVYGEKHPQERNCNVAMIALNGQMNWQKQRNYGRRNYSELCILRYKKILGNTMQSRDFNCQRQEAMIGCGVLNKMTSLGMPKSLRVA